MNTLDQLARVIKLVVDGRTIVDLKVTAGLIDVRRAVGSTPKLTPDPHARAGDPADMESRGKKHVVTGARGMAQGSLKDACAARRHGGICVDWAVFEAPACLSASGL